jgi:ADP-ribosylglycohydrolase
MNPYLSRRSFLAATGATLLGAGCASPGQPDTVDGLQERIRGLLLGTYLGDALGGPIEFQPPDQVARIADAPKTWRDDEVLDANARRQAADRLRLRSYRELRPTPESYAHWLPHAEAGTITDDSRHKFVLLHALREADRHRQRLDVRGLAQAYLDWPDLPALRRRPHYRELCADWIEEWQFGARWVLGDRDERRALPPERMWIGLPTCCGQMTLLPLAALHAGRPEAAYRAAYELAFFDNGFGKDLNAALVAGLATALAVPAGTPAADGWAKVLATLRQTDPLRHGAVRWTHRSVDRWLDVAHAQVAAAQGRPARLFAGLNREFAQTTKWEAQVPFTVVFACAELAEWEPLAALQLSLEWGHDSDSYAQLLGALVGALHGPEIFPTAWREAVEARLRSDYEVDVASDVRLLVRLGQPKPDGQPIRTP